MCSLRFSNRRIIPLLSVTTWSIIAANDAQPGNVILSFPIETRLQNWNAGPNGRKRAATPKHNKLHYSVQTFQTVENSSVPTIKAETYKQGMKPARVSLSDFVESKRSRI